MQRGYYKKSINHIVTKQIFSIVYIILLIAQLYIFIIVLSHYISYQLLVIVILFILAYYLQYSIQQQLEKDLYWPKEMWHSHCTSSNIYNVTIVYQSPSTPAQIPKYPCTKAPRRRLQVSRRKHPKYPQHKPPSVSSTDSKQR